MKSKKITPVMKQFWDAKKQHSDSIMLFRMGDFYETFDEDAIIASDILGITLTKRANGAASSVPLAGFPYHSLDQHLHKLLNAGHRVAICEQVEDPKQAKGIVKREVVEVLSPGTALNEKFLDHNNNNFLSAVFFDKNKCGISILDYSTGEFYSCSRNIEELSSILNQFDVSEVILNENQKEEFLIATKGTDFFITSIPDWCFNIDTSYENLINLFDVKSLKGFGIEDDNLAIIAAGSAYYYVNDNFQGKVKHIQSLSVLRQSGIMNIDAFTIRNLEIFKSLSGQGISGTLISTIDKTCTSAGSRLLKNWIRHPLFDIKKINKRLDRINEFVDNFDIQSRIYEILKGTSDLERLVAKVSNGKANPRDILNIGLSLTKVIDIKALVVKNMKAINLLVSNFDDTTKLSDQLLSKIESDPPLNMKKGGYIRSSISSDLDELRLLSNDASNWMANMQKEEQEKNNIPSLKVGYNRVFGYYIEVTKTHVDKVPNYYIRKQTLTNSERYFTEELKEYEVKILSAEEQIISIEEKIFNELENEILAYSKSIQNNAKILAKLDLAVSLSSLAVDKKYCRPIIDSSSEIIIKGGRHPVVEDLLPLDDNFISNDLFLDNNKTQIAIITGPNMAGKSTYLRQVGLISIMAHIGSYIPAESAKLGVIDKLFTRVGASDNLAGGESTFMVEMNEAANILNNATSKSLILLDEIGRGTSTYDGLSIAWAITEYIHNNTNTQAKTLFATHYHELVDLADQLDRAINLNVAVKEFGSKIIFLKKIISGGADKSYGVQVAEMAGLPKPVIQRAKELLNIHSNLNNNIKLDADHEIKSQINLFSDREIAFKKELDSIDINEITPLEALSKLDELKKNHAE